MAEIMLSLADLGGFETLHFGIVWGTYARVKLKVISKPSEVLNKDLQLFFHPYIISIL